MSDTSAQTALLLGPALQAGFAAVGGVAARTATEQGVGPDAAGRASQGFSAHLQALLRAKAPGELSAEAPAAEALSVALLAPAAGLVADDTEALSATSGAASREAGGKNLPSAGNTLPVRPALTAPLSSLDLPSVETGADDALTALRQLPNPTVGSGVATNADARIDLRADSKIDSTVEAKPDPNVDAKAGSKSEWQAINLEQRYAADMLSAASRASVSQQAQPLFESATDARFASSAVGYSAAERASDVMRRLNLQSPSASAAGMAVDAESDIGTQSIAEMLGGRSDAPRVAAFADSSAAQFSLHGRPAELIPTGAPATASAESVLRDLQNMMPLRPQTGDVANGWSAGLGQRLLMMAEGGVEVARLRLNPAHLGPLEIHVNVEDERAQVWFGAQHGATRDALEAALPRLREMFAEHGLELTHADVNDHHARHDGAPAEQQSDVPQSLLSVADKVQSGSSGLTDRGAAWGLGSSSGSLDIYV